MLLEIFLLISYCLGTYMGYRMGKGSVHNIISDTIDNLVSQGYIQHRKDKDGELELMKWYEKNSQK
tara:strand:+ start:432 stop:629 length:198 start_codon:yes stop_codon:yes gene_type:complete